MEIRIRNKMHGYARACLNTIMKEILQEYKLIFTQFELFKQMEQTMQKQIEELNQRCFS